MLVAASGLLNHGPQAHFKWDDAVPWVYPPWVSLSIPIPAMGPYSQLHIQVCTQVWIFVPAGIKRMEHLFSRGTTVGSDVNERAH